MSLALQIKKMTRLEKLKTMEDLWADLSRDESKVKSPGWHEAALKETEQAVKSGKVKFTDWEVAKKQLRASLA